MLALRNRLALGSLVTAAIHALTCLPCAAQGPRLEAMHRMLPIDQTLLVVVLLEDLDGDGNLELVQGGAHRLLIYTNLSRQLTWRSLPRVGGPLVLDLYGRAQQAWVLSYAPLATGEPLPPARPWTVLAAGVLDQGGRASWSIDVPPFAALVGRTWVWRAAIGGRRSNLETTTFLGP